MALQFNPVKDFSLHLSRIVTTNSLPALLLNLVHASRPHHLSQMYLLKVVFFFMFINRFH